MSLRPQGFIDLLDAGFAVIRARPGLVLGLSAVFVFPLALVSGYLQRDVLEGESFLAVVGDPSLYGGGDTAWDATVVSLVGGSMAQALVGAGTGRILTYWYADSDVELDQILAWLIRRSPVILLAWLLAHVLQVLGLAAIGIGLPVVATGTLVVAPVLGVEGGGPIHALRRSFALVRRRFGSCLGFWFVSGLVAGVVGLTLSALPTGVGLLVGLDAGWVAVALGEMLGGALSTAFVGAATAAVYLDLRIRAEGLDIELALAEAFPPDLEADP